MPYMAEGADVCGLLQLSFAPEDLWAQASEARHACFVSSVAHELQPVPLAVSGDQCIA